MKNTDLLLIYTGGTIGMVKDHKTGSLRAFEFSNIHYRIPELSQLDCNIEVFSFENPIDSSDMNPKHWIEIAEVIERNYHQYDGFVVLHGSDTMSYSASALSFMLENLSKPVIFTGSQLPIGDLRTDARENLITSIQLATLKENGRSLINEVCLYFEYKLYRANRTTKINAEHFEAFVSLNYPTLAESGVHLKIHKEYLLKWNGLPLKVHKSIENDVLFLKLFPGISSQLTASMLSIPYLKAVIFETYGSGNAPTDQKFLSLIEDALRRGVIAVNITQCVGGGVIAGKYQAGEEFHRMGVFNGKDLTAEAAVTKLMFLLGQGLSGNNLKACFEKSIRGEMD